MRSCHEIIKNEICYNEILDDKELASLSVAGREFQGSVLQQSDGSLMACIKLEANDIYLLYDTAIRRRNALSSFIPTLRAGYEINFEWRRMRKNFEYASCENSMTGSAREIERRRKESFGGYNCYSNDLYMTIVKRNASPSAVVTHEDFEEFCRTMQSLSIALANADCTCLALKYEKLLRFLKYSLDLNEVEIKFAKSRATVSDCLICEEYDLRNVPLAIGARERKYVSCLTVTALPSCTQPDLFGFCAHTDSEFRMVVKYKCYDKTESEKIVEHKKKAYKNSLFSVMKYIRSDIAKEDVSDDFSRSALVGKKQCDEALFAMSEKGWTSGLCQVSICLADSSEDNLENRISAMKKAFQKQGLLLKSERIGNSLCFLSMIAGAKRMYDPFFILSENFADMLHLTALSQGSPHSALLKERTKSDVPFIYARNTDGSVYHFSLSGSEGRKGHTFITGPTGSGKSALISLLAAQWLKYPQSRVIIIDRDLSSYRMVSENGGDFHYPLADTTKFQPLENAGSNMSGCLEFIRSICFSQEIPFTAIQREECANALHLLENGKETLTMLYHVIRGRNKSSALLSALSPYIAGGEYESLFDSDCDSLKKIGRLTMIETNKILQNGVSQKNVSAPFFVYLLSRLERAFNESSPTLLIIDEGWKVLKNELFASFFEEWMKTLRKKNADVVFSITNLQDIVGTHICETIMSNSQTRILFKDASALNKVEADNYRKIGLSEHLLEILPSLPDFHPIVLQEGTAVIVDFDMQSQLEYLTTPDSIRKRLMNNA
ncbi:MAG TPA: hypothetical protein DCO86_05235 [Spirochaetaceae bacterium]|nr:hypothetical protein [Spirochaetaceae bacterium]